MKTLDEVIKKTKPTKTLDELIHSLGYCSDLANSVCSECAYKDVMLCRLEKDTDALHYLKEYRQMKEHLACLDSHTLHGDETERRYDNGNLERY